MEINVDIKIKDLINYPFKEKVGIELDDLEKLIEEMNISFYDLDSDKFSSGFFKIKVIYDNSHDSDESSYRYLLFFKEKPICIYGYTGDRGTFYSYFFDYKSGKTLHDYFLSLIQLPDSLNINIIGIDNEIDLSDYYTTVFEDINTKEIYYYINRPRSCYNFRVGMKNLFRISGDLIEEITFIKFITKVRSWEEKEEDKFIIATKINDKKEIKIPFSELFFKAETN